MRSRLFISGFGITVAVLAAWSGPASAQRHPDRYLFVEPAPRQQPVEVVRITPPPPRQIVVVERPSPPPRPRTIIVRPREPSRPAHETTASVGIGFGRLFWLGGPRTYATRLRVGAEFENLEVLGEAMLGFGSDPARAQAGSLGVSLNHRFRRGRIARPFIGGGLEGLYFSPQPETRQVALGVFFRGGLELEFRTQFGSVGYSIEADLHQALTTTDGERNTFLGLNAGVSFRF